tara:strand:- start:180 stop:356 length:177 start_codon:yes stop_codon:yes gene_type:complete
MSKIKKIDKSSEKYNEQYDDLNVPTRKKYTKSKFKKKSLKKKKFNKQSDYRKNAKRKK